MSKKLPGIALPLLLLACAQPPQEGEEQEVAGQAVTWKGDLLARWAPVHYQDVTPDPGFRDRSDYLARVDYDGDWVARNNWDNLTGGKARFDAWVYGRVIENDTHYFLYYMFYHPIDWVTGDANGEEHEHDAESVFMAVLKDGSPHGRLQAMITEAHGGKKTAIADPRVTPRFPGSVPVQWEADGEGAARVERVRTYQESGGHGIYPCGFEEDALTTRCHRAYEDGIRYVPRARGKQPQGVQIWEEVPYGIRDLEELYSKRGMDGMVNGQEIRLWRDAPWATTFGGDNSPGCGGGDLDSRACKTDAAHPIWHGTGDPVALFDHYFLFPREDDLGRGPLLNGFDNQNCQPGPDQVSLFSDAQWQGTCVTYGVDPRTGRLPVHTFGANYISSFRLGANINLIAFQRAHFWPASTRFTADTAWVGPQFDDNIASFLLVRKDRDCDRDSRPGPGQVILYEEEFFGGTCAVFDREELQNFQIDGAGSPGSDGIPYLGHAGFPNDRLSSFKVGFATEVTFFVDPDFRGKQQRFGEGDHGSPAFANDAVTGVRIR